MATQNYTWPAVSVTATNPSVGTNGSTAPAFSTEAGGIGPDGNLHAISTDNSGNQNVNVVSSALPAGAATAANQTSEITQLTGIHSDTTAIHSDTTSIASSNTSIASSASSINVNTIHVDTNNVQIVSIPLPPGASTSALQTTGNTSLNSIDSKTPSLGQALAASSVPVVLTAAQLTTLTPLTSVTVTQATGTNLHVVVDSSALPTGASTSALQTTGNTSLASIVTNTTGLSTSANQTNGTQKTQISTPTALTVTQAAKTVGTTAVRLTVSGSAPASTRAVLVVTPDSTATGKFYIGSSSVTSTGSTRGIQIVAGQTFIANNDAGDYYIISDTAAQIVEVLEQA